MDRLGRVTLVVGAVFTVVVASATAARAQVPGEELARRAFDEGIALEEAGDYASALAKFTESSHLKRTLGNRYHRAYCLEMLGELTAAAAEYEGVERDALAENRTEIVDAARARLEPLRARVPRLALRVTTRPAGLEVLLDDAPVSLALLDGEPLPLDPGEHTLRAHAPEHASFAKTLTAREGDVLSVEIELAPARAAVGAADSGATNEPLEADSPTPKRTAAIATTGGAIALLAGGAVVFAAANGAQRDARERCRSKLDCADERSRVRTLDALALGGFVGGAGLAALSVVLWTSRPATSASASSRLVARPSWVGLEGAF